ncbi:DUF4383 domain-containing protein [Ramlibacter henchirensis]|uniref:DUF4383 domain-containing protein n=1 Tax=Ramlibacter henchirensis TaxID=204072 RepID=A0A4Z0BK61_9BURK|nr:DUF4383 domain-containing protein [Ramlibacter henchirensis]TFY99190.1 DUF4383 domain-containing protein [Ramlibacter henchirensis]
MSILRRFALVFGIVFLLVGVAGFIPGITVPHDHPNVMLKSGLGLVLGLFPVNVLHNIAHLLFGAWGLAASRTDAASRTYGQGVAIAYAVLTVMGLVTAGNLHTLFGFVPLYGHDIWLHAVLAAVGAYFGFMHRQEHRLERAERA